MKVVEWMEKTYGAEDSQYPVRPRVVCTDGYTVSVQGGDSGKYCDPRELCNLYNSVELGFPNMEDSIIMNYAEEKDSPTDTVYGFVPIEVVEKLIEKHGGIDFQESLRVHTNVCKKQKAHNYYVNSVVRNIPQIV